MEQSIMRFKTGFTLIEVLVALTIFTVAAVAASSAAMNFTQSTEHMRNKTLAHFVAKNHMSFLQINNIWPQGTSSKQVTENGGRWKITQTAKATEFDGLRRIELSIAFLGEGDALSPSKPKPVTDFTFYLTKPISTN